MKEDWDNLIILDACRYDLFERVADLSGELAQKQSRGSHTSEFLTGNFTGRTMHDTVYITASPQFYRRRDRLQAEFHAVINVWDGKGWDEEHNTVLPGSMKEATIDAAEKYPNKRIISHFLQPHYPFINSGEKFNPRTVKRGESSENDSDIWGKIFQGESALSESEIWSAYEENLRESLPAVEELLEKLVGKNVVTSDHGNMINERSFPLPIREWGHPRGIHTPELITIPWLVQNESDRKRITSELPYQNQSSVEDSVVEDRLRDLGYK